MRNFNTLSLLVFCTLSGGAVSSLLSPQAARDRVLTELLFSASNIFDVATHHVAKRQTLADYTTQDIIDCHSTLIDYQCSSPAGFSQHTIDVYLSCGDDESAIGVARDCKLNENGDRCGKALLKVTSDQAALSNAIAVCSEAYTSGSCSAACRGYIEAVKRLLGCCAGEYNTTGSSIRQLFDYRLWNLCNVDLPAANCLGNGSGLSLSPPATTQQCTEQQIFSRIYGYFCMESVVQPLIDALLQNNRCRVPAELFANSCGINANDQICIDLVGANILGALSSNPLLVTLANSCNSCTYCSLACLSAIATIKDKFGCCVNIYNNTDIGLQIPSLSYNVWEACGVSTPGFCTSTLTTGTEPSTDDTERPTNSSSTTTKKRLFWIIAAVVMMAFSLSTMI